MLVFLNVDTLTIDGKRYTSNDFGKLLQTAKIANKEVGYMLVFLCVKCPLSNFYKSHFVINDIDYDCDKKLMRVVKQNVQMIMLP